MKTKDVMTKKPVTVKSGSTLEQAAKVLVKHNISGAPVVNGKGKMVGIISEKDLFKAIYPNLHDIIRHVSLWVDRKKISQRVAEKKDIPVDKLMTKEVISVKPDTPIIKTGSIMLVNRIHRVPVVDKGKLVGIVCRQDIFRTMLKSDLKF